MNLFFPQTELAEWELRLIADIKQQIVSAGSSKPIIGCVQDSLFGVYLITDDRTKISGIDAMNMLMATSQSKEILSKIDKNKTYTGKEVFSMVIPDGINATYKGDDGDKAIVENSQITFGQLDKSTVGAEKNSLVQHVWDKYDPNVTANFIDDTQKLIVNWLQHIRGFTFSIGDIIVNKKMRKEIDRVIQGKVAEVECLITEMENNPDLIDEDLFEADIAQKLQVITSDLGAYLMKNMDKDNNLHAMVTSGSNGTILNIAQIMATAGQQFVESKRVQKRFNGRTLPHFHMDDDTALARGFVVSSFLQGLGPAEFIFTMMGGREGIIDTAIKSVAANTEIIIKENKSELKIKIGDWVDKLLNENKEKIIKEKHKDQELLKLENEKYEIETSDESGNIFWSPITEVTRHDPTNKMFEIVTINGKQVIVTNSKSLIVWDNSKKIFIPKLTTEIQVGDFVPAMKNKCNEKIISNQTINDVILDKIIEIKKINPKDHPKVYDITVPSTYNFCLANGLCVRDTADTGYTQRRLVKALEDLMVCYDGTVRNSKGKPVQPLFGDSGINPSMQKNIKFNIIKMSNTDIRNKLCFTEKELDQIGYSSDKNEEYYNFMIKIRDKLRACESKFAYKFDTVKDVYAMPVDVLLTIQNYRSKGKGVANDLDPAYITNSIEALLLHENTPLVPMTKAEAENPESMKNEIERQAKTLFRIMLFEYLAPKKCIFDYKLNKKSFDGLMKEIASRFNKAIMPAGEMVGVLAAQSIGEPATQLTLNSVTHTTKIILKQTQKGNNKIITTTIGKFIDKLISENQNPDLIEKHKGDTTLLWTKKDGYEIPSVDENGKVMWKKIEAVTKHLPINKDGSNTLLKVITKKGRKVTATKAKSFLTMVDNKIVPLKGSKLKTGMYLPIMKKFPKNFKKINEIDLGDYLPKTEYTYGSELEKARQVYENTPGRKIGWFKNNGKLFTVPHSRGDSLLVAMQGRGKQVFENGCVYPKTSIKVISKIPEKIKLNRLFGFFIGAYCAEGCISPTQVIIANNNEDYRKKIIKFCDKFNIGYHVESHTHRKNENWLSTSVIIHSTMLRELVFQWCGKGSANKKIPQFAYIANKKFVKGVIEGYFAGDGSIDKRCYGITCTSISNKLIDGLMLLLNRFGIYCTKTKPTKILKNNIGSKDIKQHYTLYVGDESALKFAKRFKMIIAYKQERLNKLIKIKKTNKKSINLAGRKEFISGITYKKMENSVLSLSKVKELSESFDSKESKLMKQLLNMNVIMDEVIKIKEVKPKKKYVYDFTVADTKTFMSFDGLFLYDTFHTAGAAKAASGGIPRLKEIIGVNKKTKSPKTTIYLKKKYYENKIIANKIATHINSTVLSDMAIEADIVYDASSSEDNFLMKRDGIKSMFQQQSTGRGSCSSDFTGMPFVIIIKMDREKMLDRFLETIDINSIFCNTMSLRFTDKAVRGDSKQILDKITGCSIGSTLDDVENPIIHIRFDITEPDFNNLVEFYNWVMYKVKLKGVDKISDASVTSETYHVEGSDKELVPKKRFVIDTNGINMKDLLYIRGIDHSMTRCNDINQVYELYGIEAARKIILDELRYIQGVNYQHLELLVDYMTCDGVLRAIDRHGMAKMDIDPLHKASYEKTVEILLNAAFFQEKDHMKSVSARIMAGQVIRGGTGLPMLIMDTDMLENSEVIEQKQISKHKKKTKNIIGNSVMDDIATPSKAIDVYMPDL